MKKLKIKGKELTRIGYSNDQAISLAINLAGKHFKRTDKSEVLELLEKIHLKPENYLDDEVFGELAKMLSKEEVRNLDNVVKKRSCPMFGAPGVHESLVDLYFPEE